MNVSAIALNSLRADDAPRMAAVKDGGSDPLAVAEKRREAFSQFVGEALYGSLMKSMRATVGEPAYFHGGVAEEMFQGRLDQQLATEMAQSDGQDLAAELFESQFPEEAALLREAASGPGLRGLAELNTLRRP